MCFNLIFKSWLRQGGAGIQNGRKFQTPGAWYWKDRAAALIRLTDGTTRSFWGEERRDLEDRPLRSSPQKLIRGQTAGEVRWYRNEGCRLRNAFCYRKPVESLQERCDMVVTLFEEERSGSSMVSFCTFCSRAVCSEVMPARKELQWSVLESAWASQFISCLYGKETTDRADPTE